MVARVSPITWQKYLDKQQLKVIEDLLEFVRIPLLSATKEHFDDVVKARNWAVNRLQQSGISNARLMETENHPIVYGDWLQAGGNKLTVHIYEHFDMQPAEPLGLWESSPF